MLHADIRNGYVKITSEAVTRLFKRHGICFNSSNLNILQCSVIVVNRLHIFTTFSTDCAVIGFDESSLAALKSNLIYGILMYAVKKEQQFVFWSVTISFHYEYITLSKEMMHNTEISYATI
jgi:hypothetical protein